MKTAHEKLFLRADDVLRDSFELAKRTYVPARGCLS